MASEEREQRVLEFIEKWQELAPSKISGSLGINYYALQDNILPSLEKKGFIKLTRNDKQIITRIEIKKRRKTNEQ